ncbi:NrsF family protein [Bradyrhizobium elkanii]|uniref:NrsF family protein n=1 Tax=Bradyrhizobium elkanii TaxID=29448 RepID=UPI000B2CBF56|nr:DUF1109 domain-containing protein [Bradyrhizobium elkanii]
MTKTPDLIDMLVECAAPVRRLRSPLVRAGLWLLFAAFVIGLIAIAHGVRPDISERWQQPVFVISLTAALATGILAAIASFRISLPGSSRLWLALPSPALALWVSTIGYGCVTDWVSMGPTGVRMGEAARCFATLLLASVPLSIAMLVMLRHAALLRPTTVSVMGGLAVAAMTSFALSLVHDLDATVMILVWNLGSAALIAGLSRLFGRSAFTWVASRLMPTVPARPVG